MDSQHHPTPEERRASVERIIAASGGKAPPGVRLIDFREPTADELAYAETLREPARRALERNASRIGAKAA
jgi:hypothetical protein